MTCLCGHIGFAGPSACVLEKGHEGDHKYGDYQQALAIAAAKKLHSLHDQLAAAQAECNELKADAMRYRWLRDNRYVAKYPNSEFDYSMHLSFTVSGVWSNAADPAVLDAQIDAAIAKGEK